MDQVKIDKALQRAFDLKQEGYGLSKAAQLAADEFGLPGSDGYEVIFFGLTKKLLKENEGNKMRGSYYVDMFLELEQMASLSFRDITSDWMEDQIDTIGKEDLANFVVDILESPFDPKALYDEMIKDDLFEEMMIDKLKETKDALDAIKGALVTPMFDDEEEDEGVPRDPEDWEDDEVIDFYNSLREDGYPKEEAIKEVAGRLKVDVDEVEALVDLWDEAREGN